MGDNRFYREKEMEDYSNIFSNVKEVTRQGYRIEMVVTKSGTFCINEEVQRSTLPTKSIRHFVPTNGLRKEFVLLNNTAFIYDYESIHWEREDEQTS